ncbi:MAG: hypothetical protein ABEJ73_00470 [Haloplanus sp.]
MYRRELSTLFAMLVALSLVGAPTTMADWGEQASFSAERVEESQVDADVPVRQYRTLSPAAQTAVRRAIESPDGTHVVYGREDFPDDFAYSDYTEPGYGLYVVVYEGQSYRLTTYAAGGFPFVYWLYELPFVVYGLVLGWVGSRVPRGERSPGTAALAAVPGVVFHLLGPEFDFPLLAPMQFVSLGLLSVGALVALLAWNPDLAALLDADRD